MPQTPMHDIIYKGLDADAEDILLSITGLHISIPTADGIVRALEGIDLNVPRGKTVCVVGESGSGKSMTARSILRLIPHPGSISAGRIQFSAEAGEPALDITALERNGKQMRGIRGKQIAMIFQEPMSALSPIHTIGNQIVEMIRIHEDVSKEDAWQRGVDLLSQVGIPNPAQRMRAYTFQLSGGMRQRAMIAMALACSPRLLIADEPTTALDVTTQAQILELLRRMRDNSQMSILFITHDLGVVAEMADEVVVMYLGTIVERATREQLFTAPRHPYTQALLRSSPELANDGGRLTTIRGMVPDPFNRPGGCPFHNRCDHFMPGLCNKRVPPALEVDGTRVLCWLYSEESQPFRNVAAAPEEPVAPAEVLHRPLPATATKVMEVRDLSVLFPLRHGLFSRQSGHVRALNEVSFDINRGEILGIVGESGCGKTTLGRSLIGIQKPTSGSVTYLGGDQPFDLANKSDRQLRKYRRDVRMVFQDPFSSLDPRMTVGDIIGEPLQMAGERTGPAMRKRISELLRRVGLRPEYIQRYPHAFSGGERQRIGIARALALDPKVVIADEAVSALDVSVQAQILNLLKDLQGDFDLTFVFIAHNLSVVRHFCDRVLVMYLGRIVEVGNAREIFAAPAHPYSEALLSAAPVANLSPRRERVILKGEIPDPANPPTGCTFHSRCPYQDGDACVHQVPALRQTPTGRLVACHYAEKLDLMGADGMRRGSLLSLESVNTANSKSNEACP